MNAQAQSGVFPLYLAATTDSLEVLKTLLKRSADVDLKTSEGRTALHRACLNSDTNEESIKILVSAGADICIEDHDGDTPFPLIDMSKPCCEMILKMLALKKGKL